MGKIFRCGKCGKFFKTSIFSNLTKPYSYYRKGQKFCWDCYLITPKEGETMSLKLVWVLCVAFLFILFGLGSFL